MEPCRTLKPWNQMSKKRILSPRIHILCNGEVLEYGYFSDFRDHIARARNIVVKKDFKGLAPWQLIEKAIAYKESITGFDADDQVWCVFDVDDYWKDNQKEFEDAIEKARENDIKLAWSNECFELWLLLHFQVVSGEIPRIDYHKKLKLAFKTHKLDVYEKNGAGMFPKTFDFIESGLRNAKQLPKPKIIKNNPSTGIVPLIEKLREFLD